MGNELMIGEGPGLQPAEQRSARLKPTKSLPTDRLSFETQLLILRAIAKASSAVDRGSVSNSEVARYANISASSISNCNQFFNESGLLVRDGNKQRPVDAVVAYDQAAEWQSDDAGHRLAEVLSASWFGRAVLAKLAIKPATVPEVLQFLAQECRAPIEYKDQVKLLLDYLATAGIVTIDGNLASKGVVKPDEAKGNASTEDSRESGGKLPTNLRVFENTKKFSIPIPDKEDAVIMLPDNLDQEDWQMVKTFLDTYVERWKKFKLTATTQATDRDL